MHTSNKFKLNSNKKSDRPKVWSEQKEKEKERYKERIDRETYRERGRERERQRKRDHRCTRFENSGGGSMMFLPNFGREVI
jgi:hypothetical protein